MNIIDIGCGRKKIEGAIGIDNSPFSMADIVLDLNTQALPFANDSIDFVHTSHCLEHLSLDGFLHMLSEIFRVCKEEGTIYITVPYYATGLNLANPFHNNQICFNEHTFRFFSSARECNALPKIEYSVPSCPSYGLKHSANTDSAVEFDLIKIDYDYFPEYVDLSADDQRISRRSKMDVVDAIHYWLKPVKSKVIDSIKKESLLTVDLNAYITEQMLYLQKQIEYINVNLVSNENNKNRLIDEKIFKRVDFLYKDDSNLLYTPNSVIGILSKIINKNQVIIDRAVANAEKN